MGQSRLHHFKQSKTINATAKSLLEDPLIRKEQYSKEEFFKFSEFRTKYENVAKGREML